MPDFQAQQFIKVAGLPVGNGQQLIIQAITEPQTMVDISGLTSGVYFVKLKDDEKVMMGKVVVE